MAQDERQALGIQPVVDCIQNGACQRHAEVGFQHRRRIWCEHRNGIARAHASGDKRRSEAVTTLAGFCPSALQVAMHHGHASRVGQCCPVEKSERGERKVIGFAAVEARCVGGCTHGFVSGSW